MTDIFVCKYMNNRRPERHKDSQKQPRISRKKIKTPRLSSASFWGSEKKTVYRGSFQILSKKTVRISLMEFFHVLFPHLDANGRQYRERVPDNRLFAGDYTFLNHDYWTAYYPIMIPCREKAVFRRKHTLKRRLIPLQEGKEQEQHYYCSDFLANLTRGQGGIFELACKQPGEDSPFTVVYLGSSWDMRHTIKTFMLDDGHKYPLMHLTLNRGYRIYVRFIRIGYPQLYPNSARESERKDSSKQSDIAERPESQPSGSSHHKKSRRSKRKRRLTYEQQVENMLLDGYNYAWNVRRNKTARRRGEKRLQDGYRDVLSLFQH